MLSLVSTSILTRVDQNVDSWSLVDNTAKVQVSRAPGKKDHKCLQASNGASRDRQVAVGALLFDRRPASTVDVAEGL